MKKCPNCGVLYSGEADLCWTCLTKDYQELEEGQEDE